VTDTKYVKTLLPIRVRHFIYFMEDRFGSHVTSNVSQAIRMQAVQGKSFDQHILDRMFKWYNILTSKQQDKYVRLLLKDLNADFITTTGKAMKTSKNKMTVEYTQYILEYCESVARSCEQTNLFVNHLQSGQHNEISEVGFFDPATDKAMTIFYNALIGTRKIKLIRTSTTASPIASVL